MRRTLICTFSLALLVAILGGGWYSPIPAGHFGTRDTVQKSEIHGDRYPGDICFAPGTPDAYMAEWQERIFGRRNLDYRIGDRWSTTATNGTVGPIGTPVTLTYSFVPDGTSISGDPSQLFARMNSLFGSQEVWQGLFAQIFAEWSRVSCLRYVQDVDDGTALGNNRRGQLGVRGDIRIGSVSIDGPSNVLAYNYFPDNGDMVLDADENWAAPGGNYIFLRNITAHEHGHGWGCEHVCPSNGTKLLEPYYSPSFDGPQHDDIRGVIRNYGDTYEPNNDASTATDLAILGGDTVVSDVGLHGSNDTDWWLFTIPAGKGFTVTLEPDGYEYLEGPQNQDGSCTAGTLINSRDDLNLDLFLFDDVGGNLLEWSDSHPAGEDERIFHFDPPSSGGSYTVQISGNANPDNVQLYRLNFDLYNLSDPYLSVNPIDFDSTLIGQPVMRTTMLINNAQTNLDVSSITTDGPFEVTPVGPLTLPPSGSVELTLHYLAEALGTQTGTLTIAHSGPGGLLEADLIGTSYNSYLIFVLSNTAEFGDVVIGTTDSARVLVRAMGNVPLTIQSVISDPPFSIQANFPLELLPSQTISLWPRFTPTALGEYNSTMLIQNSGTSSPDTMYVHGFCIPVSADERPDGLPQAFRLEQNYPNPFNPATQIAFDLPHAARVSLDVFDIQGRLVRNLVQESLPTGRHQVEFDGSDLPSGVYLYRLTAPDFQGMGKMMLLK